jgi:hypothetical protein
MSYFDVKWNFQPNRRRKKNCDCFLNSFLVSIHFVRNCRERFHCLRILFVIQIFLHSITQLNFVEKKYPSSLLLMLFVILLSYLIAFLFPISLHHHSNTTFSFTFCDGFGKNCYFFFLTQTHKLIFVADIRERLTTMMMMIFSPILTRFRISILSMFCCK